MKRLMSKFNGGGRNSRSSTNSGEFNASTDPPSTHGSDGNLAPPPSDGRPRRRSANDVDDVVSPQVTDDATATATATAEAMEVTATVEAAPAPPQSNVPEGNTVSPADEAPNPQSSAPEPRASSAIPDLSNLWNRKQTAEGFTSGKSRSLYPKVREQAIRVPPTDALLTKILPYRKMMQNATPPTQATVGIPVGTEVPLSSTPLSPNASTADGTHSEGMAATRTRSGTLKSGARVSSSSLDGVPAKPGAVAVSGIDAVAQTEKTSPAPISSECVPSIPSLPLSTTNAAMAHHHHRANSPESVVSSLGEASNGNQQASLDSNDSIWGKKPAPQRELLPERASDPQMYTRQPGLPRGGPSTFPGLSLDDIDVDVILNDSAPKKLTLGPPPPHLGLVGGGGGANGPSSPPIWGRKATRPTLEEDRVDSRQIAFAEGSANAFASARPPSLEDPKIGLAEEAAGKNLVDGASIDSAVALVAARFGTEAIEANGARNALSEEEQLENAILESKKQLTQQTETDQSVTLLKEKDIEDAKENARSLRSMVASDEVEMGFLQTVLELCRADQMKVARGIEDAMNHNGDEEADLEVLIDLNINLLDVIEMGARLVVDDTKPAPLLKKKGAGNLDVDDLIQKKDIFSLICMLRVQQNEKRLDAALALMKFARGSDKVEDGANTDLRDEIRSSGGLHSLLTLFRTPVTLYELKVVTALAVAYVLPSFVESSSQSPPSLALKIVECLRFLTTAQPVAHNDELITSDEMLKACSVALASFWVNLLEPMLKTMPSTSHESEPLRRTITQGRQRGRGSDQRQENVALDEVLETTISLVIHLAKQEMSDVAQQTDQDSSLKWSFTLVEQVCAVEIARPIAVREGILQVLVSWIWSKDSEKIQPAVSALRYVTSIDDKYMAGWIHSEMVNKGAVKCLADLTRDISVTRDVRLYVAQILSSLCTAPHTRAAIVEANCINFLVGILYEHNDPTSEEIALFAGRAILQLAAGAITRASAFSGEDQDVLGFVSPNKRDALVGDIVESGAIASFVSMAKNHRGALRSIAIQALRVLSEDVSSSRRTRLQLCDDSAAMALGISLKDNVVGIADALNRDVQAMTAEQRECLDDLHEALRALANILDPAQEGDSSSFIMTSVSSSSAKEPHYLIKGCLDTVNSGGLQSLLTIATARRDLASEVCKQYALLLEESCRSLASMAPLLLTFKVARDGYSKWARDVLRALHHVLQQIDAGCKQNTELHVIVLQGLGALAQSAPLKVRIIDETLPHLLQAKSVGNESDVSNAANHVFQSLDLADDEEAAQVAGNSPDIYAEWFCLQRSLLIQAMARTEIRLLVHNTWNVPFQDVEHGAIELMRQSSGYSRSSDGTRDSSDAEVFGYFADDEDSQKDRHLLVRQYRDLYGRGNGNGALSVPNDKESENNGSGTSLLEPQTYPLSNSDTEARWILDHQQYVVDAEKDNSLGLSKHVSTLLEYCFPSTMLRDDLIPIVVLRPDVSFNFRVLMMARRQYFSFRREGQLLSSLCDKEVVSPGSMDAYWTLGFTNSSFAGEFAESLVQVLYKCPMIRGLSFVRNADYKTPAGGDKANDDDESEPKEDSKGGLLANLTGSLPPWISHLTFDGVFDDVDLQTLGCILETMGTLSESHTDGVDEQENDGTSSQGRFWFLAIRRSPQLCEDSWLPFIRLLGRKRSISPTGGPARSTLSSLKVLDLCGNQLGDELCSAVLDIVYDEYSGCRLEQLDLSDNQIQEGSQVLRVLRAYYNKQVPRPGSSGSRWKSSLHTLGLASNGLFQGKMWLEVVTLVQNNGLGLRSLDISANDLTLSDKEYEFIDILVHTLSNSTCLDRLNLSSNKFSSAVLDRIILMLGQDEPGNTILHFDGNTPELTEDQMLGLQSVSRRTRKRLLERHLSERDNLKSSMDVTDMSTLLAQEGKAGFREPSHHEPTIPETQEVVKCETPDSSLFQASNGLGPNSITVLFSAPLVFTDGRTLRPFAKLDFDMERELIWQCLKEASRDIELSFDSATHDRLLATMAKRCSCLHYSGHGHQHYLPFEDGSGGPYWFKVDKFKSLIETEGGAPFRFVFVSACYSYLAGETFASAGVPHVVCCQQESELKDTAALAFTRQFYLALAIGHTVKDSFDQGCKAVRAAPNLKDPDAEMNKFLLLPKDGNHDVPIFNARSVPEWPKRVAREERNPRNRRPSSRSINTSGRSVTTRSVLGGARSSELSVRNMMQEDPSPSPPEFFLGREVDTYNVLKAVLSKRLVSVIGEPGIGRSSLVCALCHYINERATTMIGIDRIYFVRARQSRKRNPFSSLVQRFLKKLEEEEKAKPIHADADMETMFDAICKFLKHEKALVVFDRAELVVQADESNEFPMLLSKLCRETKHVKVLLTNRRDLGIPSLGEHPISLGPLFFADTVRLFANLCPYLHTPADRKKLFDNLVKDQEEAEVLPTDPGVSDLMKQVFSILGDGIPAKIEKCAYDLSKEDFLALYKGS